MAQIHVKTRREAGDKGFGVVFANRKRLTEKELINLARGLDNNPDWKFLEKWLGEGDEDLTTIKKWHEIFRAQALERAQKEAENGAIATQGDGWRLFTSTEARKPVTGRRNNRQCGRCR